MITIPGLTIWHLGLIFLAVELVIVYLGWSYFKDRIGVNRTFDLLLLNALIAFLLTRLIGIISNELDYGANIDWVPRFIAIGDLNFAYLFVWFVPLLTYEFWVSQVERTADWVKHSMAFLLFGIAIFLPFPLLQLARGLLLESWPVNPHLIFYSSLFLSGLIIFGLRVLLSRSKIPSVLHVNILSAIMLIVLITTIQLSQIFPTQYSLVHSLLAVVFWLLISLPFLGVRINHNVRKSI